MIYLLGGSPMLHVFPLEKGLQIYVIFKLASGDLFVRF